MEALSIREMTRDSSRRHIWQYMACANVATSTMLGTEIEVARGMRGVCDDLVTGRHGINTHMMALAEGGRRLW